RGPNRRVRGIQHLESPVEKESVDPVGALASSDPRRFLEHDDIAPGSGELDGAAESRQARAHHDHVVRLHAQSLRDLPRHPASTSRAAVRWRETPMAGIEDRMPARQAVATIVASDAVTKLEALDVLSRVTGSP